MANLLNTVRVINQAKDHVWELLNAAKNQGGSVQKAFTYFGVNSCVGEYDLEKRYTYDVKEAISWIFAEDYSTVTVHIEKPTKIKGNQDHWGQYKESDIYSSGIDLDPYHEETYKGYFYLALEGLVSGQRKSDEVLSDHSTTDFINDIVVDVEHTMGWSL